MNQHWKRYPEYRESSLPWLREVPKHWEERPLKRMCSLNEESLPDSTDSDFQLKYLDIGNVDSNGLVKELQEMSFAKAPSRARRVVRAGDTVISTVRTYLRAITHFSSPPENLIASTGFAVLRPNRSIVAPEFMAWASRSEGFIGSVIANSVGVGYPAIAPSRLGALPLVMPPRPEQRAIATFLDRETTRIDALIAKNVELINLMEEKRSALIHHLVTKGIDDKVEMKDSEIEWLGSVPVHWGIERLKFTCKLETGHTPRRSMKDYWIEDECTIPWVSLNDSKALAKVDVITQTAIQISELGMANSAAHRLPAGSVVFTRDATIGLAAIMGDSMAVSQHIIAWVCGPKLFNRYLLYAMYAMRPYLDKFTAGATLRTIGMPDVNRLATTVPPPAEQAQIVEAVRERTRNIDRALVRIVEVIDLLHEHRQALITAAVTGQIDVRGEVIP